MQIQGTAAPNDGECVVFLMSADMYLVQKNGEGETNQQTPGTLVRHSGDELISNGLVPDESFGAEHYESIQSPMIQSCYCG